MSEQSKLLNALYQNAEMGTSSIKKIFSKVQDTKLKNELRMQLSNYQKQNNQIMDRMKLFNAKPQPTSKITKMMSSAGIILNCAKDNSTGHIAEMLIQGTNMGVIKINKALNQSKIVDPKLIQEAQNMLTAEQKYIDNLKSYL